MKKEKYQSMVINEFSYLDGLYIYDELLWISGTWLEYEKKRQ
jgi:hypothetical protein